MYRNPALTLEYLMGSAIEETDGGEREAVINRFYQLIWFQSEYTDGHHGDQLVDEESQQLWNTLGGSRTARYQRSCELFRKCVQSGDRPKRDLDE